MSFPFRLEFFFKTLIFTARTKIFPRSLLVLQWRSKAIIIEAFFHSSVMAIAIAAEFPVSFPSRHYIFQWLLALQSRHAVSIDLQRCTLKENPRYFPSNLIFKILKIWAVRYSDSVHYRPKLK